MSVWMVHYELPPAPLVHTERVLAESEEKAKLHIETILPHSKVLRVE